jgi:polyisoprenoid-binding protein YceI
MSETGRIKAADLATVRESGEVVVIDVLPEAQHTACRVAGAQHACVFEVVFLDRVRELVPGSDTPIVLVGAGGSSLDADLAADKLQRGGYTHVRVLEGGLKAWHATGLPTEGTAQAPLSGAAPPAAPIGRWAVDADRSMLRWVGRNPNGYHDGSVGITGGAVVGNDSGTTGQVTVDPRSILNDDLEGDASQPALIAHLLSDDFLFVERHGTVSYEIQGVEPIDDATITSATHRVRGALTLRGVTAPLDFPATVTAGPDGQLTAEAHFDLDRTRWGMIYGSARFFAHLGMHLVFDDISIALRLVLEPA